MLGVLTYITSLCNLFFRRTREANRVAIIILGFVWFWLLWGFFFPEEEADVWTTHWSAWPPLLLEPHSTEQQSSGRPPHTGISFGSGLQASSRPGPGRSGHFSPFVPWIRKFFKASEEVQGVDSHVSGEEHIEAAEPEQLAVVAGHGSLEEAKKTSQKTCIASLLSSPEVLPPMNTPHANNLFWLLPVMHERLLIGLQSLPPLSHLLPTAL